MNKKTNDTRAAAGSLASLRELFKPHLGLPIAWLVLPKRTGRGNSAHNHRVTVMKDVLSILPAEKIKALTMDREFIGKGWLAWLRLMDVAYVVRVKKNARIGGSASIHVRAQPLEEVEWRTSQGVRRGSPLRREAYQQRA